MKCLIKKYIQHKQKKHLTRELIKKSSLLVDIVDGPKSTDWRSPMGKGFAYTDEWCNFFCIVCELKNLERKMKYYE